MSAGAGKAAGVEVLGLFDAYIAHGIPQERPELRRARAAVADLIDAAQKARPYVAGAYECAFPDGDENSRVLADLDAALRACGVQP
jgi:hypothetical protein